MNIEFSASIIIPHFKRHDHLRVLLNTIARQDHPAHNVEVIVVEDDSTLNAVNDLRTTFPFVDIIQCFAHVGAACAKNIGAKKARNEWLIFLDDDVTLEEGWLSSMIDAAQKDESVRCFQSKVVSASDSRLLKSTGGVANEFGYAWDRGVHEIDLKQYDQKKEILFASSCAMLIKKDLFEQAGGFDQDCFYMGEDYDLGLRLHMMGEKIHYIPTAVCKHADLVCDKDEVLRQKYFIERNRIFIVLKNYEMSYLIRLFVPFIFLKIFKYSSYLIRYKKKKIRYTRDIVSGWWWIISHMKLISGKREGIRAFRTQGVRAVLKQFEDYRTFLASVASKVA